MLRVTDFTHRGKAAAVYQPHLRGAKPQSHVLALLGDDLGAGARGAGELAAFADLELDVVHVGAQRHLTQRDRVAGPRVRAWARDHGVALEQPLRVQDVALLAIGVDDEGDSGAAVRIVLDLGDLARDPKLVPLEIDLPVLPLVPTTAVPAGQMALVVAAAALLPRLDQRLLRGRAGNLV